MEEVNSDPEIADLLRKLYGHPDMVELYPGLFVEDAKPAMVPGHGACITYTAGRAVLSDAVTLVRGDRFNTLVSEISSITVYANKEPGLYSRHIDQLGILRGQSGLQDVSCSPLL